MERAIGLASEAYRNSRLRLLNERIGTRVQVLVRDNNVDQALKALKKKMQREGIFREMKLRNYYEKPSEKRAREKAVLTKTSDRIQQRIFSRWMEYDYEAAAPEGGTIAQLYPEIFRCVACNACTKICPMDVEVMDYIAALKRGDLAAAMEISFSLPWPAISAGEVTGNMA